MPTRPAGFLCCVMMMAETVKFVVLFAYESCWPNIWSPLGSYAGPVITRQVVVLRSRYSVSWIRRGSLSRCLPSTGRVHVLGCR